MHAADVTPNTVVYNAAVRACATAELWPAALSLLEDMRADGVPRSTVSDSGGCRLTGMPQ